MTERSISRAAVNARRTGQDRPAPLDLSELPFARTLLFAPHPDDESIGAGALLAHIAERGAEISAVFLTSGESNPWPQRVARRRWRMGLRDRRQWGRLRRIEARRALAALGVAPSCATFLGLPDDGLASLDRQEFATQLGEIIDHFKPTLLVIPSLEDFHSDHRAANRAIMEALSKTGRVTPPLILSYVVHGDARTCLPLRPSEDHTGRKRSAIRCHATQLLLSRGRFLRYAQRHESYAIVTADGCVPQESTLQRWIAKTRHVFSLLR